ncbi:HNH endonuclease signature motif containing protein [Mycolicibacterium baixiangningiae]|uniref:HNH endonuclease signature motif containing protein n=1 Tax=Mycolicibacterium baixiangningiae TaxID=2761578 RepID=UPI0018672E76|nr:HNH endonuclease signature motif containing protein [Mycolicibacterium baixiangningiae]
MFEYEASPQLDLGLADAFARRNPLQTAESAGLVERIAAAARRENRDAAARLELVGALFALRRSQCSETEGWAADTTDAVAAEVAAALNISHEYACDQVRLARALRERLSQVAAVFAAGDINKDLVETLVYRTGLITDPDILMRIDGQLAAAASRLKTMTRGKTAAYVDRVIARLDPDAVRRRKNSAEKREVWMTDRLDGMTDIGGTVFTTTARALDQRLNALAATVCNADPRTAKQRRADAIDALTAGDDRMACRCGTPDCPAGGLTAAPVVIHLVTDTRDPGDGSLIGADGWLPPELIAELAPSAKHRPVVHPGDSGPERGYTPSTALAEFVRCRDLTCRFPGCDRPADRTDLDHTIPFAAGGPTQASNLKSLCRLHHLLKTFGGWRDQQLPDGTVIWTSPAGPTYVTSPGSALLFPVLCAPTAPAVRRAGMNASQGNRLARVPQRRRTRDQNRAAAIAAERAHNRDAREARRRRVHPYFQPAPTPDANEEPPPF